MNLNNKIQKSDVLKLLKRESFQIIDKLESLGLDTVPRTEEDLDKNSLDYNKYGRFEYMKGTRVLPDIFLHYGLLNERNYITDVVIVVKNKKGDKFLFCIEDYTDEEKEYQVIRRIKTGDKGKIHLLAESFKLHDRLKKSVTEAWIDLEIYNPILEGFINGDEILPGREKKEGPIPDENMPREIENSVKLMVEDFNFKENREAFNNADIEGKKIICMFHFMILVNTLRKPLLVEDHDKIDDLSKEILREIHQIKIKEFKYNLIEYIKNSPYYNILINSIDDEYRSYDYLNSIYTELIFKYR